MRHDSRDKKHKTEELADRKLDAVNQDIEKSEEEGCTIYILHLIN